MEITSPKNTKIKALLKLQQKSRERKNSQTFVVEGLQENKLALQNDFVPVQYFIEPAIFQESLDLPKVERYDISSQVFEKIAYRSTTGGIVGVYRERQDSLETLSTIDTPVLVVLEAVEKPGNLGAILRSCDAAQVDAVIICDPKVDFYNPNVIRSSVGTLFTNKLIACTASELIDFCRAQKIQILATYLRDNTEDFYTQQLNQPTALVFGTEATGLSAKWAEVADVTVKLPMMGQVDSLNVSNAVAVCVYEVLRQRRAV